ncbi:peptide deformylase [Aquabacter spiritensis]|uniref:Peptide deformylase-like n=1 Tax=Aquabacter spiritensis TaxID=933073 RepID=A0A4R3LX49_9HYPH|nr:peptide deformylase [Aquabacter spiritensis]TCT05211.1 peptide deformylase [Aquabacter spiritensis]
MAVLPLLRFPDPRLRLAAAPVFAFDAALRSLADDLRDTMRAAPGIGITACHVGIAQRLVVLELGPETGVRVYANPRIVWASGETATHREGSVAMPGVTEEVERPARVRIAYQDLTGAAHEEEAEGLLAVCHQHEIDQLDGIFWIERLSRLKRDRAIKKFEKLLRRA